MKKGDSVEIVIEDMSGEGQGIGKADGFVVFVPGTVVGDKVKAEMTRVKKNYGFADMVEMVETSPYRSGEFDCFFSMRGAAAVHMENWSILSSLNSRSARCGKSCSGWQG